MYGAREQIQKNLDLAKQLAGNLPGTECKGLAAVLGAELRRCQAERWITGECAIFTGHDFLLGVGRGVFYYYYYFFRPVAGSFVDSLGK